VIKRIRTIDKYYKNTKNTLYKPCLLGGGVEVIRSGVGSDVEVVTAHNLKRNNA